MTAVVWWAVGLAAMVVLARLLIGPVGRVRDALARRRRARLRAEALLRAWLSPGQRTQYRARGWFEVTTAAGHRYRVRAGGGRAAGSPLTGPRGAAQFHCLPTTGELCQAP
jgi:hypothetical protein